MVPLLDSVMQCLTGNVMPRYKLPLTLEIYDLAVSCTILSKCRKSVKSVKDVAQSFITKGLCGGHFLELAQAGICL